MYWYCCQDKTIVEAWSKLACFTFRAHFLFCYCILNSNLVFKTFFYRPDTDYWVFLCLKNTWLGQYPVGCHAVYGVYDYPSWRTGVSPLCLRCPATLKYISFIQLFLTILNHKTVCACRSSIMAIPPVPNQSKTFKFLHRSFCQKTQWKDVFSVHGSQIERGYITMRQNTSRIVMYVCCLQRRKVEQFESW